MAENSLNIVDMVKGYLTGGFTNSISSFLGESKDRTQAGIDAAVPGILSGFDTTASTPDGAQRLASAVDKGNEGILSNLSSIFGKGTPSDAGSGVLQSILGSGALSQLTGLIGRSSGLSSTTTGTLLSFLAPVVLGALKKLKSSNGLDATGLSSLLSSQRSNIAAAMPEGMREGTREPVTEQPWEPREVRRPAAETTTAGMERPRSSAGWVLPLVVLGLLAGLIWRWSSQSPVRAGREAPGTMEQTYREKPGTQVSLDMLKDKYRSVIDTAQTQGVRISSMTSENGKMVIRGTAPSMEAANKVWDEIKRVNPSMNDIVADFSVQ
jgi:Bacterial protein of unknown function (DUF937)